MQKESEPRNRIYRGVNYGRQLSFFDPSKFGGIPITIIGAGAIGSFTCLCLAKVGFHNITVWDDDKVSEENIPNQFYPVKAEGEMKVNALLKVIEEFTGVIITPRPMRFLGDTIESGVVLSTVDSMASRMFVYQAYQESISNMLGMVDARMGGLVYRIYTVMPAQVQRYQEYWYPDMMSVAEPCTEKAVIFNVAEIASKITRQVCGVVQGETVPFEIIGDIRNVDYMKQA